MKREQTRVEPTTRVTDIKFTYQRGADVQATWRKFGWVPPSATMTPPPPEKVPEAGWEPREMRRVK
jgi:hypothetical protein